MPFLCSNPRTSLRHEHTFCWEGWVTFHIHCDCLVVSDIYLSLGVGVGVKVSVDHSRTLVEVEYQEVGVALQEGTCHVMWGVCPTPPWEACWKE